MYIPLIGPAPLFAVKLKEKEILASCTFFIHSFNCHNLDSAVNAVLVNVIANFVASF